MKGSSVLTLVTHSADLIDLTCTSLPEVLRHVNVEAVSYLLSWRCTSARFKRRPSAW